MAQDWPRVKVSEVCESIVDCVNKAAKVVEHVTPYKMIRTTNVRDGYVNVSEVRHVDKNTYEQWTRRQVPQPGDVILTREAPLGEVMGEVTTLLDRSVDAEAYLIAQPTDSADHLLDLSQLDIAKLQAAFEGGRKRPEAEKLRRLLSRKLGQLVAVNRTRMNYHEHFSKMIDDWNAGTQNIEAYFQGLLAFAEELSAEEERHFREGGSL